MWNCICGASNPDEQDMCGRCGRGHTGGVQALRGGAPGPVVGAERRSREGRRHPYRALRALAKLYTILAPLVLAIMLLIGLGGLAREATLAEKLGSSIGLFVLGGIYYLLMKSVAQAIYILFDIAGDAQRLREVVEMRLTRAAQSTATASK